MHEQYLLSFLLSLLLALFLMPILIRNSARWGLVDDPASEDRKIHDHIIPRSGGLAIILASALSVVIVLPIGDSLLGFLAASAVIIFFGLLDDLVQLKPKHKLLGQALCIAVAMAGGMVVDGLPFVQDCPMWLCYLVTFVFGVGVINGINFLDGMDGLAAGTTIMSLLLLFVLGIQSGNVDVASIALAVSAALLGFLRFNTHPARIFMGDSGSQFLGFVLAWLSITVSSSDGSNLSALLPILILGIPVMDIIQVLPTRYVKGLVWTGPDKEHFHHQIAKQGFHQYEVVAIIYLVQAILLVGAYLLRFSTDEMILLFYFSFVVLAVIGIHLPQFFGWKFRPDTVSAQRERRNPFFRRISSLHSYTDRILNALIALVLLSSILFANIPQDSYAHLVAALAIVVLIGWRLVLPQYNLLFARIASYLAVIILMYAIALTPLPDPVGFWFDILVGITVVVLVLSMRITRRVYFGLNTEDLLVAIFLAALGPMLLFEFGQDGTVVRLIYLVALMLYACEYLLSRGERARKDLTVISIAALVLAAVPF